MLQSILRAFQFSFLPLKTRMSALVKQRRSDRTSTPVSTCVFLDPCVYFAVTRELGTAVVVNNTASCEFTEAAELDAIFPPTAAELDSDSVVHPYYGHSMKSRWYDQTFDLRTKVRVGEVLVCKASRQFVLEEKGISLQYDMKTHMLSLQCVWKGVHKDPSQDDLTVWMEGFVNRADGTVAY